MTELMNKWIMGVTCGAMIAALLQVFLPKGGIGKIGRLAGGLVLLLATVKPLFSLDMDVLTVSLAEYRLIESGYTEDLTKMNQDFVKELIEEQTEAYILDKAEELGIQCEVTVSYEWNEDGVPYPTQVRIVSSADQKQEEQLARLIEADLGVSVQSQVYERMVE